MLRLTAVLLIFVILPGVALAGSPRKIPSPPQLDGRVTVKAATWLKRPSRPAVVRMLATRWYTITVRDDSKRQNFHLVGPGVNKKTTIGFSGIAIWGVHLRPGTYRYGSDRSTGHWRTFRVVRG
jgi:hypothetical protein